MTSSKETYDVAISQLIEITKILYLDIDTVISHATQNTDVAGDAVSIDLNDFYLRTLVRTIFPAIEGLLFNLRQLALALPDEHLRSRLDPKELAFLRERKFTDGQETTSSQYPKFKDGVKKTLELYAKAHGRPSAIDFTSGGWTNLIAANDIRNALVHAKTLESLKLTEINKMVLSNGYNWFKESINLVLDICIPPDDSLKIA